MLHLEGRLVQLAYRDLGLGQRVDMCVSGTQGSRPLQEKGRRLLPETFGNC